MAGPWQIKLMTLVVSLASVVALGVTLGISGLHFHDQLNWSSYYDPVTKFGHQCQGTQGIWPGSFVAALEESHQFVPMVMPHRGSDQPPRVDPGHYLIVTCDVDLRKIDAEDGRVSFGPVFGSSAAFINGQLRGTSRGGRELEVPLLPGDIGNTARVTLISKGNAEKVVGMASLVPPYASSNPSQIGLIKREGREQEQATNQEPVEYDDAERHTKPPSGYSVMSLLP